MKREAVPPVRSRSLGARLVLATLGFCFFFTLAAVGMRTLSAWNNAWAGMQAELTLLEQVYRQTLSKAIWEMDRESLNAHVESAAQVRSVGRISVKLHSGARVAELVERVASGWVGSTVAPTVRLALVYEPFPGGRETVGELVLEGDERVLWARLRDEVKGIVITQLLQSLLLAGLIMLLFNRSVTVHVQHIARHLAQLGPSRLGETLRLERSPEHHDELSLLESGVNQLQGKLLDHLTQLRRYEDELAQHRDRLADLVQARTNELEALTEVQQLVLSLSNRLIHAPHDSFANCQRGCLHAVAQRLGARRAVWWVPPQEGDDWGVFSEWSDGAAAHPVADPALPLRQVPAALEANELLLYPSRNALVRALGAPTAAVFTAHDQGACALAVLRSGAQNHGLIYMARPSGQGDWSAQDKALLAMTAQMLLHSARHQAQLLKLLDTQEALRLANRQLQALARQDPLTGLYNRRHFDEIKEEELQRARRNAQALSLLVCDIDYFKNYNDTYGHGAGDQCLRAVAQAMASVVTRSGDVLARIGGEEFAVVLPATTLTAAVQVAQRVRQAVFDLQLPHASSRAAPQVSLSIGVAQLDLRNGQDFDELFEAADQALYLAKQHGRNRVESGVGVPEA